MSSEIVLHREPDIQHPVVFAQSMMESLNGALKDVLSGRITPDQAFAAAKLASESTKMLEVTLRCYELLS